MKRKRDDQGSKKSTKKGKTATGAVVTTNPFKAQAMRTGGWASPASMKELKFIDTTLNPTLALAATWSAGILINGCIQGTEATQRIGRKIVMKNMQVRWKAIMSNGSTGGDFIRMLFVYDKQANTTAPAITDILLTDHALSNNNLSNRDRFVVVWDKIVECISITGDPAKAGKKFFKVLNLETMFNTGNAGTIGDIQSGSFYFFAAQGGSIGAVAPNVSGRVRIKFVDQ